MQTLNTTQTARIYSRRQFFIYSGSCIFVNPLLLAFFFTEIFRCFLKTFLSPFCAIKILCFESQNSYIILHLFYLCTNCSIHTPKAKNILKKDNTTKKYKFSKQMWNKYGPGLTQRQMMRVKAEPKYAPSQLITSILLP